jgi:phospholipid/cholesterol/gamma-HCH transport system substrate-binding protein
MATRRRRGNRLPPREVELASPEVSPPGINERDELTEEEEEGSRTVRIAVRLTLAIAALVVVYVLLFGGSEYTITAEFENAAQLVPGSQVVVAGVPSGSVKDIALGDHGQALVTFTVEDPYAPLKQGTHATIRSYSLSGIANRQVQLELPAPSQAGPELPSGSTLSESETTSEVDLDQLFNTLNARTIKNFKHVIEGFELSYQGVAKQANTGFRYLNPFLSTSRQVFGELTRDTPALERLLVDTSHLTGALAERSDDLTGLIHNADLMMGAIGSQSEALREALVRFPDFMRTSNTTFVNLRATLDDLDPLVDASKPVAERLGPFFSVFRRAARDAVPTITDLERTIQRPGSQNDLVELTRDAVPLARAAIGSGSPECGADPNSDYERAADGDFTQGSFGESVCSLQNGLPNLAFFRAYTPELVAWFNDFGTSGPYDANGAIGRIGTMFNAFTPGLPGGFADPLSPIVETAKIGGVDKDARCPGTNERDPGDNSTPFTDNGTIGCDPRQVPMGP